MSSQHSEFPIGSPLKVGTRGSVLAVWQTQDVVKRLNKTESAEVVKITTSGDRFQKGSLADIGGKGLFTKEIDQALLNDNVDIAVHSLKDLETTLPDGLAIGAVLPRDDPRDSLVGCRLEDIPQNGTVATCSVRRASFIRHARNDVKVVPIRGNVQTRLDKMSAGLADATFLSYAGLKRLNYTHKAAEILETSLCIPAVGQGVIVVLIKQDRPELRTMLDDIHCVQTHIEITAERCMLSKLDGSCHTPIGGYARLANNVLHLEGVVYSPDGRRAFRHVDAITIAHDSPINSAIRLGERMGEHMAQEAADILAESRK